MRARVKKQMLVNLQLTDLPQIFGRLATLVVRENLPRYILKHDGPQLKIHHKLRLELDFGTLELLLRNVFLVEAKKFVENNF